MKWPSQRLTHEFNPRGRPGNRGHAETQRMRGESVGEGIRRRWNLAAMRRASRNANRRVRIAAAAEARKAAASDLRARLVRARAARMNHQEIARAAARVPF
jgi:hypothetical protein